MKSAAGIRDQELVVIAENPGVKHPAITRSRDLAAGTGREFALGAMSALYARLKTAEAVARAGVEAGALFDKNSGLPMTLYSVKLKAP